MSEGSTTTRTTSTSISTATPNPTPSCFISTIDRVAKIENTATITTAALVTVPADPMMPSATALRIGRPRSTPSRIRLTTNTW